MKIEFTNDEMATLTAIILAMSEDVKKGMFDDMKDKEAQKAKKSFAGLSMKVAMANFELMKSSFGEPMDAEILDEEE